MSKPISPPPPHLIHGQWIISTAAHTREEVTQSVRAAFKVAHKWLQMRGLKMDQVKCELIHFTKSNRGHHSEPGPTITIPMNTEGETRTLALTKCIKYLGMWIDSQLTLTEHIRETTMKAMTAAHSLRLLGNSERGIHQTLWRQLYYSTILPITLYGLPLFW